MTKPIAKIGDLIKSKDFANIEDYYMIGRVVRVEGDSISCRTISQCRGGQQVANFASHFTTYQNGTMFMDKMGQRITILDSTK